MLQAHDLYMCAHIYVFAQAGRNNRDKGPGLKSSLVCAVLLISQRAILSVESSACHLTEAACTTMSTTFFTTVGMVGKGKGKYEGNHHYPYIRACLRVLCCDTNLLGIKFKLVACGLCSSKGKQSFHGLHIPVILLKNQHEEITR